MEKCRMHSFFSFYKVVNYTICFHSIRGFFKVNGFSTSRLILGLIINHITGKDCGLINLLFHALLDEELMSISKSRKENPLNIILQGTSQT